MKRHPALRGLSHDHHHGLVQAHRLMKAGDKTPQEALAIAEAFGQFGQQDLARHFRQEEDCLIGALKAYIDVANDMQLQRMLAEHEALQQDILDVGRALARDTMSLSALREIGERLEAHIRFEERNLFPRVETLLTEDELQWVRKQLESA